MEGRGKGTKSIECTKIEMREGGKVEVRMGRIEMRVEERYEWRKLAKRNERIAMKVKGCWKKNRQVTRRAERVQKGEREDGREETRTRR